MGLDDEELKASTTCPECLELERKQPLDGVLARRIIELEGIVAKQDKTISKLKDSMYDLRHDYKEVKKAMEVIKELPTAADIEALKNLCALVAGESRDNLQNLKTRTEKKMKSTDQYINQQKEAMAALESTVQSIGSQNTVYSDRIITLETSLNLTESGGLGKEDSKEMKSQLDHLEKRVAHLASSMAKSDDDKRKKKPLIDSMKSELQELKQIVHSDHEHAIRKLQKKEEDKAAVDLAAMEESLKRALMKHTAKGGGPVYADDMEKVKRHIRSVERKVSALDSESRDRSKRHDADITKLGQNTAEALQQIASYINSSSEQHSKYIPSFPETTLSVFPDPPPTIDEVLSPERPAVGSISHAVPTDSPRDGSGVADMSVTAPVSRGGGHPYIEDAAEFDRYVRRNFDMDRLLKEDEEMASAAIRQKASTAPSSSSKKS